MKKFKSRTTTNRKEYKILSNIKFFDQYYDEGWSIYRTNKNGFIGSKKKNKYLFVFESRIFRSWKYNRKTKWK